VAKKNGLAQEFFIEGYELSGDVGSLQDVSSPHEVLEVPVINKSGMVRVAGRSDGAISFNSWFDDASELAFDATKGLPTADSVILYALGGAVNDAAAFLTAKRVEYGWVEGADGSLELSITARSAIGIPLEWGVMLSAGKITHSSASSSASRDDGASSSKGAIAVVEIVDTDSGTPTIVIEDSPNDSSWSTLISFTAVASGSEPKAERKTVTGTINRYLRITTTGTFSNCDFAVAYRRGLAEDDIDLS